MNGAELRKITAESPAAFRNALLIDDNGTVRKLGECLDPWQRQDFEALDHAWRRVAGHSVDGGCQRAWLERPRGHSKTGDMAVMVTWVLLASRRKLTGVCAAGDEEQAGFLRQAIEKLCGLNRWLGDVLDVQKAAIVNRRTGSELKVITSDAPTSYGLTPDFVVADEVTHWKKRDLWDSLFSAAAKRRNCLLLVICNAGFGDSWQWELRESIRADQDWYFHRLNGPLASWIDERRLAEQRRHLPSIAFDRLWLNIWTCGAGDALREQDIQFALSGEIAPPTGPERGWVYVAGLDLGLTRDASALAVVGRHVGYTERQEPERRRLPSTLAAMVELGLTNVAGTDSQPVYTRVSGTGRIRLAALEVWQPKRGERLELAPVEAAIDGLNRKLGLACVAYDPWQAQYLGERLRKLGIRTEAVDQTGPNLKAMATATLEAFSERYVDLYQHERLLADLRALRVEERSYGVRLTSPRGPTGHGDTASALSLALLAAQRAAALAPRVDRPLLAAVYE
ncbi:MAG TPA: terminase large subunit [Pirellulales bacterium]|nr:terminase large subunit [Pirellulales bacterium]